jgi:hypothetical protein
MSFGRSKGASSESTFESERSISRRGFLEAAGLTGVGLATLSLPERMLGSSLLRREKDAQYSMGDSTMNGGISMNDDNRINDEIVKEKIRRALLSGPASVTRDATVVEMDAQGKTVVLRQGTNQWVCMPGNENIIGAVPMCLDPMGMQWFNDLLARKPKPTNATPGLIYMLCGATQHSYTDPFDTTSPAIPIGPHWMVLWPFDAAASGLPTVMRDAGTMIMFAGTPYAHLHICGSPLDGNEYHPGDRGVWTMTYSRP